MVKMMTTEPSVVLKLKKGGHVSMKHGGKSDGHKMMNGGVMAGLAEGPTPSRMQMGQGTLPGVAPARPSLAMRRKMAMKRPMVRPMMKEGGETKAEHAAEMKKMAGTEAKLKKHASMPASKAHKGLKTGGVAMGQSGYKKGGSVPKSGILPVAESERGAKSYVKTKMDTAHQDKAKGPTGGVKMGAAGYNTGGVVMGQGGYKKGGATKKHYATGGLVDSGKPVAYPKHQVSKPVANNMQSGTFKKGGKVKFNDGGAAGPVSNYERDMTKKNVKPVKDPEAIAAKASRDLDDALNPISMVKELGGKLMDKIRGKGSVTETKESVTVTPPQARRKAGGAC